MWPTIDASPAATGATTPCVTACATTTAAAPLSASSTMTITAGDTPLARNTFVAPTLPLPIARRSIPRRRVNRNANGTDPRRYATATTIAVLILVSRSGTVRPHEARRRALGHRGNGPQVDP